MRQSKLFSKTSKNVPRDIQLQSHKLLYQAGFIRESVAGRYYFLPLGMRVRDKIVAIIEEEMNKSGAMKLITPVLHPLELWKETNRTSTAGFELMQVKDRRGADFALGGTAEEMMVDLVRKFQLSYKDLPFNIYQFSQKFRDEMRARGGLLRVREFLMKDAYSFHADAEDFKKEYEIMSKTYKRIFNRLGLDTMIVEADNGYIGGDYCHEFQVQCEAGEDVIFHVSSKNLNFNKEIAPSLAPEMPSKNEEILDRKDVFGEGIIGVTDLAKFLKIPVEKTTKTILFETENEIIAAALRGDYDINELKLKKILNCQKLELASAEKVAELTGAELGYAGIIDLPKKVKIFMDDSMQGRKNFEMGANKTNYHSININFGRDIEEPERFYDFKIAREGDLYPETKEKYKIFNSIEVGNIFQLGFHYSKLMNAKFVDVDGVEKHYYMGCYGIGIGRNLATIAEKYHDARGMIWPEAVAPFQVHLISIKENDKCDEIYQSLVDNNIEVLYDNRDLRPGEKFGDCDLIGCPVRVVVSAKTLEQGVVEVKRRDSEEMEMVKLEELVEFVKNI